LGVENFSAATACAGQLGRERGIRLERPAPEPIRLSVFDAHHGLARRCDPSPPAAASIARVVRLAAPGLTRATSDRYS
jgi:hypothetical protein